jgi:hypothetical protein
MCKYSYLVKGGIMLSDSADGYVMKIGRDSDGQVFKATFIRADLQATIAGLEMVRGGGVTEPVIARIAGEALMQLEKLETQAFKAGYVSAGIAALIQALEVAKVQVEDGGDDE